jgi:hypothetical protein
MKNKLFLMGILTVVLAFGLVFVGCGSKADAKKLIGTWNSEVEYDDYIVQFIFTGSDFTIKLSDDGVTFDNYYKGTFILIDTDHTLVMIVTHVNWSNTEGVDWEDYPVLNEMIYSFTNDTTLVLSGYIAEDPMGGTYIKQ